MSRQQRRLFLSAVTALLFSGFVVAKPLNRPPTAEGVKCLKEIIEQSREEQGMVKQLSRDSTQAIPFDCRLCHTFEESQLTAQPTMACRKHSRRLLEGTIECTDCHDEVDLEDIYGHNM